MNGSTGYALCGDFYDKESTAAWAISGWFFCAARQTNQVIASRYVATAGWYFQNRGDTAGFAFEMFGNTGAGGSGGVRMSYAYEKTQNTGRWCHVVCNVAATKNQTAVYLNNVALSAVQNQNDISGTCLGGASVFGLGARTAGVSPLKGGLANMRIHSRVLTTAEIADLYYDDKAVAVDSHWKFSEGSGTLLEDSVGNADGTITTPVWSATNVPRPLRTTAT